VKEEIGLLLFVSGSVATKGRIDCGTREDWARVSTIEGSRAVNRERSVHGSREAGTISIAKAIAKSSTIAAVSTLIPIITIALFKRVGLLGRSTGFLGSLVNCAAKSAIATVTAKGGVSRSRRIPGSDNGSHKGRNGVDGSHNGRRVEDREGVVVTALVQGTVLFGSLIKSWRCWSVGSGRGDLKWHGSGGGKKDGRKEGSGDQGKAEHC
jgi:hypothetical protein